ncbi:hypothetical protein phiCT453A_29 (endogenous virus) [Clostridium phage phiCT453A]|uniref:hypothetical protein n=1 Tax=Clostridium phage phiCT453A TaxID=1567012 RepID=UPI000512DD28|nr:hypothetical protein [Clostridium tetani]YP_009216673.1 hypothetical protein phiCT453A_29 [Clostridium phage phiCT453A]AJA42519.1 hypothetical protein phiCT453A_29 [Clostridium phage phiCT453A]KGI42500.1 hypothetical protein KY55_10490 [Clostridium tetani]RXM58097.1 hypothetical protein DP133_07870 [Clostridium tetani]BDR86122.1 hypothetical protein N071400001_07300 [Clostridium tetani]
MKRAKLYFNEDGIVDNRVIKLPDDISDKLINITDIGTIGFETEENKLLVIRSENFIRIEEI